MYENDKYKITKIIDHPGPRFEVHVLWLQENKYEKIFMNDEYLEEVKLINRLDEFYEEFHDHNRGMDKLEKCNLIETLNNKYCKGGK